MRLTPVMEKYILHWGERSVRWGVNRTVAARRSRSSCERLLNWYAQMSRLPRSLMVKLLELGARIEEVLKRVS